MQNKITTGGDLLNERGELNEAGYATTLIKDYKRDKVKAGKLRIKEWDYYLIYNKDYAVAFTIADNAYMGLNSFSLIDFNKPHEDTKSFMTFMPRGKVGLPATSKIGDVSVEKKGYSFTFLNDGKTRIIKVTIDKFVDGKSIDAEFTLTNEPKDSMVIMTPFAEKKTAFYYNQKIIGFKAKGRVRFGEDEIVFDSKNTRGMLDWGRGVWTYKNTWYWGAANGVVGSKEIGFNIGYGFGDTSKASENMVFVNGVAHKLDRVTFNIPTDEKGKDDYLSPWTFSSNDGRFEMNFSPIIDRHSNTDAIVIGSNQHQVFGLFSGTIVLDNGEKLKLKDFLGFAEKVKNKW